jgi:hypothetical protein
MAQMRQPRPYSGAHERVKAMLWHKLDSQGHILAHMREARPYSGTNKTANATFWTKQDSQGHILAKQDSEGHILAQIRQSRPYSGVRHRQKERIVFVVFASRACPTGVPFSIPPLGTPGRIGGWPIDPESCPLILITYPYVA